MMSAIAENFSVIAKWVALLTMMIMGTLIYERQKDTKSFVFIFGLMSCAVGQIIQVFIPAGRLVFDGAGTIVAVTETPMGWYMGSILSSTGIFISVVGFGLITLMRTKE